MFLPFVAGVVMAMLGLALLIQGKVQLRGRAIAKVWARRLGVFMLLFFPVILLERFLLMRFDPDEAIDRMVVHGSVTAVWVLASVVMLLIAIRRPGRPRLSPTPNLGAETPLPSPEAFAEPGLPEMGLSPPPARPARRSPKRSTTPEPKNPFDFD